ncbi:hypothetical protein BC833DRAFT_610638 [Globomyces pollinis-pini]|nr:hypothetical protein BC833DRAFT_610638 [Globomyces pollinis-pini]
MHLLTTKLQFEPSPFYKYSHTIKFQLLDAGLHEPIKWHYMIDEKSKKKLKESHYKLLVMIGDVDLSNDKMATLEYPNGCQLSSNYQNIPILGSDKKLNIVYPGDITKTVKIDKTNQLCFRFFRIHIPLLITLSLYEEITESHLIKQLKIIRKTDNLATRMSRLKELDTDVIPGLERVSLKDPYTLCRILTPIKSIKCPHTQCYDGCTFLQMNRKIPMHAWECPICKRSIRFEELIIDEFFQHLLKSVNDDFVFINADGSLQLKVRDAPARKRRRKESGSSL